MKTLTRITCALMALMIAACDDAGNNANANQPAKATIQYPFKVTTTCGMVTDIVRQIAGDKAIVTGIMGEGVDPHLYKPTRDDVKMLREADAIFYSGLMLEGRMGDTFVKMARTNKSVYAVTEEIDHEHLLTPKEFKGHEDPHVWMDASAWSQTVNAVANALSQIDSANANYYRANATAYTRQLGELHAYAKKVIATVPKRQRVLITAHDAFNYFGRAYDIKVMGIQGISTESKAGVERINELVQYIVENNIRAVFVESSVPKKNVRALIEGAKQQGKDISIGGELFSDAMGAPDTYEGTYIGMIDHNATTIARALGGQAPGTGMNGKLTTGKPHE